MARTEIIALPKELRVERRLLNTVRSGAATWLPIAFLSPIAFMAEVAPAAIGILLIVGFTIREYRRSRTNILPLLELADMGNVEEARTQLTELAKRETDWHRKSSLIALLSTLELRCGNRNHALILAQESVRHPQSQQPILSRSLDANLAMILMLNEQTDQALQMLSSAPIPDPFTDCNRIIIWARAGRWGEIADYKYQRPPKIRGLRHNIRVMALLKAAAISLTEGGALKIQRYLDEARPTTANEFDYLRSHWPELDAFIKTHPELESPRNILQKPRPA